MLEGLSLLKKHSSFAKSAFSKVNGNVKGKESVKVWLVLVIMVNLASVVLPMNKIGNVKGKIASLVPDTTSASIPNNAANATKSVDVCTAAVNLAITSLLRSSRVPSPKNHSSGIPTAFSQSSINRVVAVGSSSFQTKIINSSAVFG